jgi:glutathionylspermidine synthase
MPQTSMHQSYPQQQSQSAPQAKLEWPTCQICWKQGHYVIDCYHRMDFAYQGKNPTTKLTAMASASNIQHTQSAETWLTNSGASDHISASSNNLHELIVLFFNFNNIRVNIFKKKKNYERNKLERTIV